MKSVGFSFPNCRISKKISYLSLILLPFPFKTHIHPFWLSSNSSIFLSLFSFLNPNSSSSFSHAMAADSQFHVLAVDESIIDRKLIETLLKTSSFQVTAVDSGSKALEYLGLDEDEQNHQNLGVNLIITDYSMPGMTGYDLLRKIKKSKYFKDVPVVIMSSENVASRINRCFEEGAEEFFLKPVQLSDVKKLKPHLLNGKTKTVQNNTNKRKAGSKENQSPNKARKTLDIWK